MIKIDVSDNFVNLSEHFQANVWRFELWEKDTKGVLLLLLCFGKCPHNRPSRHGYLLATDYKNHPIGQLWISKQRLKAKCQNLITMDSKKNLMQRFMSDHRELFGLVKNYDSPFFFVCIVICLLRYYVYIFFCKLELFWAWPSYTRIPTNQISYSYSYPYAYETPTLCSCRLLLRRMLTPECYSFTFSIVCLCNNACLSKNKYRLFVPSFVSSLPFEVHREVSQP